MAAISGRDPFILHPDGLAWLYVPNGLVDGPLPTHYEPHESPVHSAVNGQDSNPTRQTFTRAQNLYNLTAGAPGADVFPFVMTTYRLTEHHTAGGMSRTVALLAELQPEMFCERSPQLARLRGLQHGGWATIATVRTAIEARVLVTERIRPLQVGADPVRTVHQIGLPYHWGARGIARGDAANELLPLVLDRNVHISEYKAATCDTPRPPPARAGAHAARGRLPPPRGAVTVKLDVHMRSRGARDAYGGQARPRVGFFTDTSICIGCKACEVAARSGRHPCGPAGIHRQVL